MGTRKYHKISRKTKKSKKGFRKTRSKRQKGGNGKRILNGNDEEFLKKKKEKNRDSINMARLFGYRNSPERDPRELIPAYVYTDPDGVIERQAKFNKDMEIEGEYIDAKEDGITFGGKITKKSRRKFK